MTIQEISKNILASNNAGKLSATEKKFLISMTKQLKKTFSTKQKHWVKDLGEKTGIETGIVTRKNYSEIKAKPKASASQCDHGDLGSLGYRHGDTVKCPHCGQAAKVW